MTASLGGEHAGTDPGFGPSAGLAVTALYAEHALGLTRLALIMTGNRQAAEDIVQDAFGGLHRRRGRLRDPDKALSYVRAAVLNGCRSEARRRLSRHLSPVRSPGRPTWSRRSRVTATSGRPQTAGSWRY